MLQYVYVSFSFALFILLNSSISQSSSQASYHRRSAESDRGGSQHGSAGVHGHRKSSSADLMEPRRP